MRKKFLLFVIIIVCVTLLVPGLLACSSSTTTTTTQQPSTTQTSTTSKPTSTIPQTTTTAKPTSTTTTAAPTTTAKPTTTQAPTTTAATSTTASAPIVLKFAHHAPPVAAPVALGYQVLLDELVAKSNGRIKVESYPSGSLLAITDMWDGTKADIADLTWCIFSYQGGAATLTAELPFLPFAYPTTLAGAKAMLKVYQEGLLDKDLNDVKVLGFSPSSPQDLFMTKATVTTVSDLKGKRIRVGGDVAAKVVSALGGTPITMPTTEAYTALERGAVDGIFSGKGPALTHKFYEPAKFMTYFGLGGGGMGFIMNKDKYNSLPSDLRALVDQVLDGSRSTELHGSVEDADDVRAETEVFPANGVSMTRLTDAQLEPFGELLSPVWNQWVKEKEAAGLPAKALAMRWIEIMKTDFNYTVPVTLD